MTTIAVLATPYAGVTFVEEDTARRAQALVGGFYAPQRLPTEPIDQVTLTLTNVVVGSEIRIYRSDGIELGGVENSGTTEAFNIPVYEVGSSFNQLMLRIVHVSYNIIELPYTLIKGPNLIPVQQRIDPWYSNPA